MITAKQFSVQKIIAFNWQKILFILTVSSLAFITYVFLGLKNLTIPFAIMGTLGGALAILIGFRTGSAYARWWESVGHWYTIQTQSKILIRFLKQYSTTKTDKKTQKEVEKIINNFVFRQVALLKAMANTIKNQDYFEIKNLEKQELLGLEKTENKVSYLLSQQSNSAKEIMENGILDPFARGNIETPLGTILNSYDQCQKVKNTPFPAQYNIYTNLLVWLFCSLLPFATISLFVVLNTDKIIVFEQSLAYFVTTFFIMFFFFLIERIGGNIQDPFVGGVNDIPVYHLTKETEIILLQEIEAKNIPNLEIDNTGFLY